MTPVTISWIGAIIGLAIAIVNKLGEGKAIFSLALATMIITAVGVFIPVAVLIGAGAIAGLISASKLSVEVVALIKASGISGTFLAPIAAAAMVHTGATVIDHLPQGNYFHVTASGMKMSIKERLSAVPYESIVGGTMMSIATILYGFILK